MKKIVVLMLLLACFTACNKEHTCYICNKAERDSVAAFIERTMKPANNMSDEEMEDVIKELRWTAITVKCRTKILLINVNDKPLNYKLKDDESIYFTWRY